MTRTPIPFARPSIDHDDVAAVAATLASGWLGPGPQTEAFERRLARYVGARDCVAVSSGTAALHLALVLSALEPGDEVIVPAITFIATASAAVHAGGRIVFADVEPDTLTVSVDDVARKLSARTRVIVPVHYGGHPCDLDALDALVAGRRIAVIEDAAHALGARYRGRAIGSCSHTTCFSFNAVKNLTTMEGGAVTTASASAAARLRRLRMHGIDRDTWWRTRRGQGWRYRVVEHGFKYGMPDPAAALGLSQLSRLDAMNARRRVLAARYDDALGGLEWLQTPGVAEWATSAHHNYAIRVPRRDRLRRHLLACGVETGVHYEPLHRHPVFAATRADVPVADAVWPRLLLLPMFPALMDDEQARIVDAIIAFGRQQRPPRSRARSAPSRRHRRARRRE